MNRYNAIRYGGQVRRYHTHRTIGHQTVAEHSWGVATILLQICLPSKELLCAALYHDVAEATTGDVPANAKRLNRKLAEGLAELEDQSARILNTATTLTPEEEVVLKAADLLELLWYCHEQLEMGNRSLDAVWRNGVQYLNDLKTQLGFPDGATVMLGQLKDMREEHLIDLNISDD